MKFRDFVKLVSDSNGFMPTPKLRWIIRSNNSPTAREEAIAAAILEHANPRENITYRFPWGKEQTLVLQQLWMHTDRDPQWRDVPIEGVSHLFSTVQTEHGPLNVPEAIREPGTVVGDFHERIRETLGEDF